jgi:hypothetical protein
MSQQQAQFECRVNGANKELPLFSSPFLTYSCPNNFTADNELILKDADLRRRAMINTLDCTLYESQTMQETSKGSAYDRVSGVYYRNTLDAQDNSVVQKTYCRTN